MKVYRLLADEDLGDMRLRHRGNEWRAYIMIMPAANLSETHDYRDYNL